MQQDRLRKCSLATFAIDRVQEMKPLANGDATSRLRDGRELRMNRSYRDEVMRRCAEG